MDNNLKHKNDDAAVDVVRSDDETVDNLIEINSDSIKELIYTIRGKQVMLDSDLAMLYQVETRVLNQAVKRNIKRFPEKFMFRLTDEENKVLISQIVTSKNNETRGGRQKLPYVFSEAGIAMLSAVLRSEIAIEVSVKIIDAFVEMRHFLLDNRDMFARIHSIELNQLKFQQRIDTKLDTFETKQVEYQKTIDKKFERADEKFEKIFDYIAENKEVLQKVFFNGQIYDAYSLLVSFIKKANRSIILIDNYVDTVTLDILSKRQQKVKIYIYTSKKAKLTDTEIVRFNQQYGDLKRTYIDTFHDRFMIIDKSICYHIGASIKDAGKKSFAISKIADKQNIASILNRL